jgi:uncharacterized protein (TIGR02594 family)
MQLPKALEEMPWLNAGYREFNAHVGRIGTVAKNGKPVAAHDVEGHILNNPRILEYFATVHAHNGGWSETHAWCSAFVNWCMRQAGIHGTGSAMARSWLHWHQGDELQEPRVGAVVVFPRGGSKSHSGHVAMVWSIHGAQIDILGGNQDAHRATAKHEAVTSHVSIEHGKLISHALGFFWPKTAPVPHVASPVIANAAAGDTMLILRGLAGHYGGKDWPRGALDEDSAKEYARRRNYQGRVLDIEGSRSGAHSEQTRMALEEFRRDKSVTALYGFSAGGYCVYWILNALTHAERKRLRLVVVLGAPHASEQSLKGTWELVYRTDPPGGHMAGPRVLLASLH